MAAAGNARNGRSIATMMRQSLRTLERRHNDLEFFTEDFRSNATIINAHVLTNLELLNKEVKRIEDTNVYVQVLEQRIVQLEDGMRRILGHLEIEERVICNCGRGRVFRKHAKVSTDQDFPLQPVEVERRAMKHVLTQTRQELRMAATQTDNETPDIEQDTSQTEVAASRTFPTSSRHGSISSIASSSSGLHGLPGSKDETKYPSATKAMRDESKKTDSAGQKALMCHSGGAVKWTPDEERWSKMLRAKADCCFSPWIILPAMLGGYKMLMRVEVNGVQLKVKCSMPNDDYNRNVQEIHFPWRAYIELQIYGQSHKVVNIAETNVELNKAGKDIDVFRFDVEKADIQKPPTFHFKFDKSTKL